MKIGNQDITSIYVGNEQICTIYIGNEQVYNGCSSPTHDYSQDYLTFVALEDGTFTFSGNSMQYSVDDGATWTTLASNTASPTVTAGSKILWKQTGLTPTTNGIGRFSSTGRFNVEGNIMSLHYGDEFQNQTDLSGKNSAFRRLFSGNTNVVSAENLVLPAITLTSYCYSQMFNGCTSLTTAPELPATTLENYCYSTMFYGCTSLTVAPELPATTLASNCYSNMFANCTSLTTAPELSATTLASSCYSNMFINCTSLTTAPELPATTLASSCYYYMFGSCTSLSSITCYATDISATNCTNYWVSGVAASGTFNGVSTTSWQCGDSGIPSGWSVNPLDGGIWSSPCNGIGWGSEDPDAPDPD